MRFTTILATGTALAAFATASAAYAAEPATPGAPTATAVQAAPVPDTAAQTADAPADGDIVVTARQREESLKDVPIAITALTGAELHDRQVNAIKDIAAYTPGLSINSDSVGRAFISIRGIGTTLIDTVQPGVGIFIDGVYQPNTSYLNSPIVDVARIEVLRGPQGTLFGNNTLGGAINVITRQPSDTWTGRFDAAVAGTDDYASVSGSVSGPIAPGLLQFRIGGAYHAQNGFGRNTVANARLNPLEQSSLNGTLRLTPASWAVFTLNGSYDHVYGGNTQYIHVAGPTDYTLDGATNAPSRAGITYKAVNLKGEFNLDSIHTKLTAIGAFNQKDLSASGDGDYGAVDLLRTVGTTHLVTYTAELRADTQWSDNVSTLIGVYGDRYITRSAGTNTLNLTALYAALGLPIVVPVTQSTSTTYLHNDTRAVFGTAFFKFGTLDLAIGGRYDHQRLIGSQVNSGAFFAPPDYVKSAFQPRVTLTNHWTPDFMTYASVSKGIRGGGQNGPGTRPQDVTYKGDYVWTYEVGTKFSALDHRLTVSADLFYNDYHDFIGQNSLAPNSTGAGFVAINLNTGHVKSYGAELEAHLRVTNNWRIDGGVSYLHARITDDSQYFATTGTHVSTDHIIFTPDYNFNASTTYTVPVGDNDLVFDAGIVGKGSRYGSSLDPLVAPLLKGYTLANASVAFKFSSGFTIAAFGTNLFNTKYIESYIDKSALVKAGLAPIASNLAIQGDRRRYGVRASFKF
jgi:iron complex outermembrane receptor protein